MDRPASRLLGDPHPVRLPAAPARFTRAGLLLLGLAWGCGSTPSTPVASEEGSCCPTPTEAAADGLRRSLHSYTVPDVTLVNQRGERVPLRTEFDGARHPIAINFIFTTCTTICPVMTATFSQVQEQAPDLRMYSISLDPEYDSPKVLAEFATRYRAGERWQFLTGDAKTMRDVYAAFDALYGSKMNHEAFTLFKLPGADQWVRVDGLSSGEQLAAEYRRLTAAHAGP